MITRTQLHDRLSFLLNTEAAALSDVAEIGDGTGAAHITNEEGFDAALNDAAREMCRQCIFLPGHSQASMAAGNPILSLPDLGANDIAQERLWAVSRATFNTADLFRTSEEALAANNPGYLLTAAGDPIYYWVAGDVVSVWPTPDSTATLRVDGPALPKTLGATSPDVTSWDWAPDDVLLYCLPRRAAATIAAKNADDQEIAPRGPIWMTEYAARCAELYRAIPSVMARMFYTYSPYAAGAGVGRTGRR